MPTERHFVGRRTELARFLELLEDPTGKAVLILGQQGMGKSFLARRMLEVAREHPILTCGTLAYEVARADPPESVMARMLEDAFAAVQSDGSFSASPHRRRQWKALIEGAVPKGKELLTLAAALQRNPQRPAREQITKALTKLSEELADHHRVLVLVDSEKFMHEGSEDPWRLVVRELPPKVVVLFAQRPEDVIGSSAEFQRLPNVISIPESPLPPLGSGDIDELLRLCAPKLPYSLQQLREHFSRLDGHPYAAAASLDLLLAGTPLSRLPPDPHEIAAEQWDRVLHRGDDARRLFEAHAVVEVPVPDQLVCEVAGLELGAHRRLLADAYLRSLLLADKASPEDVVDRRRLYHSLLAEAVREALTLEERLSLHRRAAAALRGRLEAEQTPDPLPALRLPDHVLNAEGQEEFANVVAYQVGPRLLRLGLLDQAEELLYRCQVPEPPEPLLAAILNLHGLIARTRGDLNRAEEMHTRSLEIEKRLGRPEGMASDFGNLAVIYQIRGDLDRAEELHTRGLEIDEQLGRPEGMANGYGSLGLVYLYRGELDPAENMIHRSLEIYEHLGNLGGMAKQYGNLGLVYQSRGNLDRAVEMHTRSLEIEKRLGQLEGMANQYGNLGAVYRQRGDLDRAEEMHTRSLELEEQLGRLSGIAGVFGNIGIIYKLRDQPAEARTYWIKSLGLFRQLGAEESVQRLESWLDSLGGS